MCKFNALGISWPPRGWDQLGTIQTTTAQAIAKDPASARVAGLSYTVEPLPVYQKDNSNRIFVYAVHIDGWEYTINNESREFPILSFMLQERTDKHSPKHFYMSDIKTKSRPVRLTERSAHRSLMAALLMMKQISGGQLPDANKILRLYKIHPTQRSLYDIDNERHDSLYCGLPYVCVEDNDSESA